MPIPPRPGNEISRCYRRETFQRYRICDSVLNLSCLISDQGQHILLYIVPDRPCFHNGYLLPALAEAAACRLRSRQAIVGTEISAFFRSAFNLKQECDMLPFRAVRVAGGLATSTPALYSCTHDSFWCAPGKFRRKTLRKNPKYGKLLSFRYRWLSCRNRFISLPAARRHRRSNTAHFFVDTGFA